MDPSLLAYNLVGIAGAAALAPLWLGSRLAGRWSHLRARAGLYTDLAPARPGPRVWMQAVSVGEVGVALALARELWRQAPQVQLTVTTSTDKGLEAARELLGLDAVVAPFPLDLPWPVIAATSRIRPHVYVSLETEIWPNLMAWLDNSGADLLLLNGRLSPRSFPGYQKVRPLVAPTLRRFFRLSMIGQDDAQRITALGAPPQRVTVDGNAKYAGLAAKADPALIQAPKALMNLDGGPLLVAGSVRSGEERPVLEAFKWVLERHPRAVLAAVPRHVEKGVNWLDACRELGLKAGAWSKLGPDRPRPDDLRVVVVDVMGVLMGLYGLAAQEGGAAYLGASLVELGGQNPMEPAAWGLTCCFGPSMEDFADAAQALTQAKAARWVNDREQLAQFWGEALEDPQGAKDAGRAGVEVVSRWSGAAKVGADIILESLVKKGLIS